VTFVYFVDQMLFQGLTKPMNSLENTIILLLREKPFYGHFLLNLRRAVGDSSSHAAGVTIRGGVPTLSINPPLFEQYTARERQAYLEHLVKHILHLHPLRRKQRNTHDWDAACDLAINPTIAGLPADALMPELFGLESGLAAEEYYALLSNPFDTGNLDGSGYGDGEPDERGAAGNGRMEVRDAVTLDDHAIWDDADSTPLPLAEEMVRTITRDSLRGSDGEAPGDVRELVENLLRPSAIPWRQVLRQFVATAGRVGRRSTWMREHRRFSHDTPGNRKRRRLNLLVGIDVSDSTNIVELREAFAAELLQIAGARETSLTVIYANSRIQRVEAFKGAACVARCYDGGGFTDLRPLFEYARGMHPLPAAVIYLTDGIGPAPEEMEFPTLWVLTRDGERPVPWGVELRLAQGC
jgi:predicted metal-dependent peptidase